MSRFTVGQEITPKSDGAFLTYGKFYRIVGWSDGNAVVVDNYGHRHEMTDDYALTREEYEQAEREKDPFAPGKWVVCVRDDWPAKVGNILKVISESYECATFTANIETDYIENKTFYKSHFRPATLAEIKEQEMKIMDEKQGADEKIEIAHVSQINPDIFAYGDCEKMNETNRQTFTVGGQEFYIGQSAWAVGDGLLYKDGDALDVLGMVAGPNFPTNVSVRNKKTLMCFSMGVDGLTTTPPKPHEWKFGDWARHPECGVLFVTGIGDEDEDGDREIEAAMKDGTAVVLGDFELTYISTAEIPE